MSRGGLAGVIVGALVVGAAILDVLANAVGIAESSTLTQVVEWAYPVWVLVLAGVIIASLVVLVTYLIVRGRSGRPDAEELGRRREHDRERVREIREALPRPYVNAFLRDHDFGAGFPSERMDRVFDTARHNDAEDRLLDSELEALRAEMHEAISDLSLLLAGQTFPALGNPGWQDLGVRHRARDDPETRLWNERRTRLNEAATRAAEAYDALLDRAREKTLL